MSDHSNSIDRDNDLLSALVDPQYTPLEIFRFWQETAGNFPYLGAVALKEGDLVWDHELQIAVTKNAGSVIGPEPQVRLSGDSEVLDGHFGLPLYRPGMAETDRCILAFMTPEQKQAWPVTLNLTRNIVYEKPYSILSIHITPGTWGCRHLQYSAIEKVFRCFESVEDLDSADGQTAGEAGKLAHRLQAWENREVDFGRIRRELWSAAQRLVERFSEAKPALPDIPMYAPDGFEHDVWIDQMQWWEDTPARKRSIAYWSSKKTTAEWDRLYNACMKAVKGTWPSLVEILQQPPVSPVDMERLISFLADINWPGAFEAYEFLINPANGALQFLDDAIEHATAQNDEPWLEMLQQAKRILRDE